MKMESREGIAALWRERKVQISSPPHTTPLMPYYACFVSLTCLPYIFRKDNSGRVKVAQEKGSEGDDSLFIS